MPLECKLLEKVSPKTNEKYYCIEVYLSKDYKRIIFVTKAELEIIKLATSHK